MAARDGGTGAARNALLHEVLELTVEVARREAEDDPTSVPPALRGVLRMAKLGSRALRTVDRAGADDRLRARVAEVVEDGGLDPAGRLWLERPDGWEEELDRLVAERIAADEEVAAARAAVRERRARAKAEAARDRAQEEADRLRVELEEARRLQSEARAGAEAAAAAEAKAVEDRRQAVRELKDLDAAHRRAHAHLRAVKAELEEARRELAARPEVEVPEDATSVPGEPADAPATAVPAVDTDVVAVVAEAVDMAASLGDVLAGLAERVAPQSSEARAQEGPAVPSAPRVRRRRAPLPGGVHDDSPEAAAHLVRRPGAVLLVDGYNVALAAWPDPPLPEQRERLVAALDALEARTGLDVTVVFDGVEGASVGRSPSRRVGVRFTPDGLEADDDILASVDLLPPDVTVLVATDDRRVRRGARSRGANLLSVAQLRAVMG